jgi:hypothetical protein
MANFNCTASSSAEAWLHDCARLRSQLGSQCVGQPVSNKLNILKYVDLQTTVSYRKHSAMRQRKHVFVDANFISPARGCAIEAIEGAR